MAQGASKQQLIDQLVEQLTQEGVLDDQFSQLLQLQDESNPDFIEEVIILYFDDSASKLQKLVAQLSVARPDFAEVDQTVHQLKGSSASFGARAIARSCVQVGLLTSEAQGSARAIVQQPVQTLANSSETSCKTQAECPLAVGLHTEQRQSNQCIQSLRKGCIFSSTHCATHCLLMFMCMPAASGSLPAL